jgi:hypothetical protein
MRNFAMTSITTAKPRLAVAMIIRNAADELRSTIQSVCDLADEIVVLDTGSTDDTPAVAIAQGAKLLRRPWDDDFAAARNACLAGVSSPWVLWLDAGEYLPPESQAALSLALHQGLNCDRAYLLPIVLPSKSGTVAGEQAAQVRLHPCRADLRFQGRVRERLDESVVSTGLQLEILEVPLHRSDRHHEADQSAARAQRNIRLADLAIAERGPTAAMHNCLGEALQTLSLPKQAADHYRRSLDLAARSSPERLEAYYGLLSCLDGVAPDEQTADRQAQLTLCMKALENFPLDAHLLVALGIYLRELDHLALAARAFDAAFRHGQIEPQLWHLAEIREMAASCAAAAYQHLGQMTAAQAILETAQALFPNSRVLQKDQAPANATPSTLRFDKPPTKAVPPSVSLSGREKPEKAVESNTP